MAIIQTIWAKDINHLYIMANYLETNIFELRLPVRGFLKATLKVEKAERSGPKRTSTIKILKKSTTFSYRQSYFSSALIALFLIQKEHAKRDQILFLHCIVPKSPP